MWRRLGISNDQFIRTTDAMHQRGVRALIERILERNPDDFYEKAYEGWYCVGCESFKQDAEIVDGKCVLHPTRTLEWVEERNWFFRLSRYTDSWRCSRSNQQFLQPESRRNEMLALIERGSRISRPAASGSRGAFPSRSARARARRRRPTCGSTRCRTTSPPLAFPMHGVGSRGPRSCTWWARISLASTRSSGRRCSRRRELPLPERVWGHGFVLFGGERFSKSAGVRLDVDEAINRYGADAFRYFLLREVPFDADGNFSWERFDERYNADLANAWGNLSSRVIAMVEKYRDGVVPPASADDVDARMPRTSRPIMPRWMARVAFCSTRAPARDGVRDAGQRVRAGSALGAREGGEAGGARRGSRRSSAARAAGGLLAPFMPSKAQEAVGAARRAGHVVDQRFADARRARRGGLASKKGASLFPKAAEDCAELHVT